MKALTCIGRQGNELICAFYQQSCCSKGQVCNWTWGALQDFAPTNASVNGEACTLSVVSDIDAPVPELPGSPAVDEILQPVTIQNSTIIGVDGQPLNIRGINWWAPAAGRQPL